MCLVSDVPKIPAAAKSSRIESISLSMVKPRYWLCTCAITVGLAAYVVIFHMEISTYSEMQSYLIKQPDMKSSDPKRHKWVARNVRSQQIYQRSTTKLQTLGITTGNLNMAAWDIVPIPYTEYTTIKNNASLPAVHVLKFHDYRELPKVYCWCLGRIGNCLFSVAAAYAVAHKTTRLPMLSEGLFYLNKTFNNLDHLGFFQKYTDKPIMVSEKGFSKYTPSVFTKVAANRSVALSGYFQSYKYFYDLGAEIRELFTFTPALIKDADKLIKSINIIYLHSHKNMSISQLTFVGIHIRQGDYGSVRNIKLGYKRATVDYLFKARYYFTLRYNPVVFIVLSDTPEWGRKYVVGENVFHPAQRSAEHDLALLSRCNHTITSVGTYSWWAGYLAGGEVTYYHEPYNISREVGRGFVAEDFFPPSWIPISNMTDTEIEAKAKSHASVN